MLNYIWLGLILLAVLIGGVGGNLGAMTDKGLDMARVAGDSLLIEVAPGMVEIVAVALGE